LYNRIIPQFSKRCNTFYGDQIWRTQQPPSPVKIKRKLPGKYAILDPDDPMARLIGSFVLMIKPACYYALLAATGSSPYNGDNNKRK